jgi:hypothetical protein
LAAESGAASIFSPPAAYRQPRLPAGTHADAICLAREHAAKFVKMLGRDHRLELRRNSDLAFDAAPIAEMLRTRQSIPSPSNAIVALFGTRRRRLVRCSLTAASARRIDRLVSWPVAEPAPVA